MRAARATLNTIGAAFFATALPPLAIALGWLIVPPESMLVPLWTLGCGGAALAFAGLALLMPEYLPGPRRILAALSITALAGIFDWVAFGHFQGGWQFMLESLMNALSLRHNAAHNVVVLFAVLLNLLALLAWTQWFREMTRRDGTPLKRPGRKARSRATAAETSASADQ
jgi:hypothetical protein